MTLKILLKESKRLKYGCYSIIIDKKWLVKFTSIFIRGEIQVRLQVGLTHLNKFIKASIQNLILIAVIYHWCQIPHNETLAEEKNLIQESMITLTHLLYFEHNNLEYIKKKSLAVCRSWTLLFSKPLMLKTHFETIKNTIKILSVKKNSNNESTNIRRLIKFSV